MTRKVLIIACFFPPIGGAGVQRAAKFVKYLSEYDWLPVVLTVKNPSVPVLDETLLADIPETVPVYRARTREPGYAAKQAVSGFDNNGKRRGGVTAGFKRLLLGVAKALLQPDPQILWLPGARRMARQIFAEHQIDAIVATAPPFSSLLLGAHLSKKYKVPLLLDYRDEWDISNEVWENKRLGPVSRWLQARMQDYALRRASVVTATTVMSTESLATKLSALGSSAQTACIYNGYDHQDIEAAQAERRALSDRYVLSYVGTLWNLTSIEPLVEAVLRLQELHPELVERLEIQLAGRCTGEQDLLVARLEQTSVRLIRHDYLAHRSAVALMMSSQGLCLLLSNLDMARRVVPAKLFEYMTSGNSIFVIAPRGEVWDLVESYPRAWCSEPDQTDRLTNHLAEEIRRFLDAPSRHSQAFDHSRFERRSLAGDLAGLLDEIV